jgi:hypothetical protein
MIDLFLLAIVGLVTWTVAAEGAWGAVVVFLSVLFSGLLAMDLFEPVAGLLESAFGSDWGGRVDIIALLGIFSLGVFGLRTLADKLVPSFINVNAVLYDVTRWAFALLTGYTTMAIVLTALHTAPLPREFLGFRAERKNLFGLTAPDRQWLGFVQYVSEKSLSASEPGHVFDGAQFTLPGHEKDPSNSNEPPKWPTFVIRYATRRDNFGAPGGMATASAADTKAAAPRPTTAARPGGL